MKWTEEALREMEKVPGFVRKMAKSAVEKLAREKSVDEITVDLVQETKDKYFSMVSGKNKEEKKTTKVAVVRCNIVSEVCPGVGCLRAFNNRKVHFEQYGPDTELIGFFTCGGCSGRRVSRLVEKLKNYDLDVLHLSSCMCMDLEDYQKCPFKNQIKKVVEAKGVKVVEGTHH